MFYGANAIGVLPNYLEIGRHTTQFVSSHYLAGESAAVTSYSVLAAPAA